MEVENWFGYRFYKVGVFVGYLIVGLLLLLLYYSTSHYIDPTLRKVHAANISMQNSPQNQVYKLTQKAKMIIRISITRDDLSLVNPPKRVFHKHQIHYCSLIPSVHI